MEKNHGLNRLSEYITVSHVFSALHVDFGEIFTKLPQDAPIQEDVHDFPELLYITQGRHQVFLDGQSHILSAGQLIIYGPNVRHWSTATSRAVGEIISFDTDSTAILPCYNRVITPNADQRKLLMQIFSISQGLFRNAPQGTDLQWMIPCREAESWDLHRLKSLLELFFLELHQSLPENVPQPEEKINQRRYRREEFQLLADYMESHMGSPVTLEQISRDCSMGVDKIKKLFHWQCGCSPMAWLAERRIDAAKAAIRSTSQTFAQIAGQLGFCSPAHFSRSFKEKTGLTPSEYARSVKNIPDK